MAYELRQRLGRDTVESEKLVASHSRTKPASRDSPSELLGYRHWLIVFALVGATYGLVVWLDHRMPAVVPSSAANVFSEERARVLLKQLTDLGPRISGSDECEVSGLESACRDDV